LLLPNISSLFKWANNFFPGSKNQSQDFLQCVRQSDGEILGWIDENGIPRGSLAVPPGGVLGPLSSTDGDFAQFSGSSGQVIEDNGLSLSTDGTMAADSDALIPSQKAVVTYVGAEVAAEVARR
jgi:hypothetical protein